MKRVITNAILVSSIMLGIVACSDKKPSIEEKKVSLETKINTLKSAGFDINKSSESSYILTIKNSKRATLHMLSMADMATLDTQALNQISEAVDGAKVAVEVDWEKYASGDKDSVFIYYLGNGKEPAEVKSIFDAKKLGAYLTFDDTGVLKKADIKDIDEQIAGGSETVHLLLKGAGIKIDKSPTKEAPSSEYVLDGGELSIETKDKNSKSLRWGYKDLSCSVSKTAPYLGTWNCKIPAITIDGVKGKKKETVSVAFRDTELNYKATSSNKKIKADILFAIPSIDIEYKDGANDAVVQLKDMKVSGVTDNVDETMLKEIYSIAGTVPKDHNETFAKYMKLMGEFMASGMTFDFKMSLSSVDSKITEDGNATNFALKDYQGEAKGSFDKTINYQESAKIKLVSAKAEKSSDPMFELKGFKFGYAIKDMYNFFPEFMEFAGMTADKDPDKYQLTKEEQKKLTDMGRKIVHSGLGFSLKPIGIDSLIVKEGKQPLDMKKVDLFVDAVLSKNDLKLDSPMAFMMLMQYLQADGKLVLKKEDLDALSKTFSPQMMAIVMMYAKYEGDKAVFELKFEKGHLMVNGKPVM